MEDFFYRELIKYLKLAEEKRRWNLFKDIPWHEANPSSSEEMAQCTETFGAVEMYLPDFTSKMLHMIRRSRGRAWFHVNWGYEESKHSITLETWLLASGHRSEKQRKEFEESLLGQEWELPFDHPRQMVCYTMIQELATFWNYRNLERFAIAEKDNALTTALRLISVDERVHYNFYRNAVKEWMRHDERGTVEDLQYVFEHFTMPGHAQIPGYEERSRILAKTGIYGPREYVKLVKNPVLEDLGLSKDFKKMEAREQENEAEKAERIERLKREQIVLPNGSAAIPKNSSPLNGLSKYANGHAAPRPLSPMLEAVGFSPHLIGALDEIATLRDQEKAGEDEFATNGEGSRGMPRLTDLDQRLMTIGDELSNDAEVLRAQRAQSQRKRLKNQRLRNTE
jgi:acyl-[acyl-carrier-protein] desaturase